MVAVLPNIHIIQQHYPLKCLTSSGSCCDKFQTCALALRSWSLPSLDLKTWIKLGPTKQEDAFCARNAVAKIAETRQSTWVIGTLQQLKPRFWGSKHCHSISTVHLPTQILNNSVRTLATGYHGLLPTRVVQDHHNYHCFAIHVGNCAINSWT